MTQNYDTLFCKEIDIIKNNPKYAKAKPRLLLHACCAPCSSAVLEKLEDVFDIAIYFYNPNIHPHTEYCRRLSELDCFLKKRMNKNDISLIESEYNQQDFFDAVQTERFPERKIEKERGERCYACYALRIEKMSRFAYENAFDYFTATLSISPHKDAHMINEIGKRCETALKNPENPYPLYLYADFKKRNGYKRSSEISKEFGLYRQEYCGCVFSQNRETNMKTSQN